MQLLNFLFNTYTHYCTWGLDLSGRKQDPSSQPELEYRSFGTRNKFHSLVSQGDGRKKHVRHLPVHWFRSAFYPPRNRQFENMKIKPPQRTETSTFSVLLAVCSSLFFEVNFLEIAELFIQVYGGVPSINKLMS